jgi:hypothetical protein
VVGSSELELIRAWGVRDVSMLSGCALAELLSFEDAE